MNTAPEASALRSAITDRVTRSPGVFLKLRAARFGLDAVLGRTSVVELYYEAGDPHSHLAVQILPELRRHCRFPVAVRLTGEPDAVLYPEEQKQRGFALQDCQRVAPAMGLSLPVDACPPSPEIRLLASRILLQAQQQGTFEQLEPQVARCVFAGDKSGLENCAASVGISSEAETCNELQRNGKRRAWLGHYLPGMWHCGGDWFWGVDRLGYLVRRIQEKGGWDGPALPWERDPTHAALPVLPATANELEFFFSFRSPYSYVAAIQLREALPALGVKLRVRPVLPMAMRGFKIPASKRLYIARDVRREADRLGIPFGRIADPLGAGAERVLNTFRLAQGSKQQLDFCCETGTAIWSQGVDVATDEGLQYVCERAGIDGFEAQQNLAAGSDLSYAEENRDALFGAGYWGVPCYRIGGFSTWGRDRFWMIRELVRRQQEAASKA